MTEQQRTVSTREALDILEHLTTIYGVEECVAVLSAALDEREALKKELKGLAETLEGLANTLDGQPLYIIKAAIMRQGRGARAALAPRG